MKKFVLLSPLFLISLACEDNGTFSSWNPEPIPMDEGPTWSPNGEWICYSHTSIDFNDSTYPTGLYIIDTNGQNRSLVIEGQARNPGWSPDGSRIVFNGGRIYTITPRGDSLAQVTTVGGFFPSFSPDGAKIVFDTRYNDPKGSNVIWIVNVNGDSLHDISEHGTGEWRDPEWSPDGNKILHIRFLTGVSGEEIFVMNTSGENGIRLTNNNNNDSYPSWSYDGKFIIWTHSGTNEFGIWIMKSDGTEKRKLVDGGGGHGSFSPQGNKIVFTKLDSDESRAVLWIYDLNSLETRQLTH